MHPTKLPGARPDKGPRHRRLRKPFVVAFTASFLGVSAIATSASGLSEHSSTPTSAVSTSASAVSTQASAVSAAASAISTSAQQMTIPGAVRAKTVVITGEVIGRNAKKFAGIFTPRHFMTRNGKLFAVGRLRGVLGHQFVNRRVALRVTGASSNPAAGAQGFVAPQQIPPTPGACSILNLVLGPLDLNLLGLRVRLNQVNLLIEAVPGAGALLGNLLCAVAGLLNGGLLGGTLNNLLTAITNLLNGLLGSL